jgi:phage terminase large subunit-like protein
VDINDPVQLFAWIAEQNRVFNDPQSVRTKLPQFKTRIPLVEVFERLKHVKADAWQRDFCNRLQTATEAQHVEGTRALVHAPPQFGKSVILAQIFEVWLLGHDPLHRFALATYNIKRSHRHANVAIRIMQSKEYKDLFPNKDSHLPTIVSPDNFFTNARRELNDGQASLNPMGLQSGFVGSGADTLVIDDPYKSAEEAMSETIRENIEVFWDETANVRITEQANVIGMFHRYHQSDLAGYLLATGEFDYWRYAAEADGDYLDDETGLVYRDPLDREEGEFISTRFSKHYYDRQKSNPKTWYSQFQGKPTGEEGNAFNVKKIEVLDPVIDYDEIENRKREVVYWARAWDNAVSEIEGSAFTVGTRMGITLDERILIDDIVRDRLNTAERYDKQLETARDDGYMVPILVPQDPGSAGKDTAFQTQQMLEAERYTCYTETVSGSKELRAQPLSLAVNMGKVTVALSEPVRKELFKELKNFPLSTFKDQVDASGDAYRHLFKLMRSGTVIKNYAESRNVVSWGAFAMRFGSSIPSAWKLYVGCRISADASKPSGAVIVAHASQSSGLKDSVFIVDEFKQSSGNYYEIFSWISKRIQGQRPVIYLNTESESIATTARVKLDLPITLFDGDAETGLSELNWFFLTRDEEHPFNAGEKACGIYYLTKEKNDLLSARQESVMWKFNDKGEPQPFGGIVMDCVRMVVHGFRTKPTELTGRERFEERMSAKGLSKEQIERAESEADKLAQLQIRLVEERAFAQKKAKSNRSQMPWRR